MSSNNSLTILLVVFLSISIFYYHKINDTDINSEKIELVKLTLNKTEDSSFLLNSRFGQFSGNLNTHIFNARGLLPISLYNKVSFCELSYLAKISEQNEITNSITECSFDENKLLIKYNSKSDTNFTFSFEQGEQAWSKSFGIPLESFLEIAQEIKQLKISVSSNSAILSAIIKGAMNSMATNNLSTEVENYERIPLDLVVNFVKANSTPISPGL